MVALTLTAVIYHPEPDTGFLKTDAIAARGISSVLLIPSNTTCDTVVAFTVFARLTH